jgi:guanine nucleotide-exchange factor
VNVIKSLVDWERAQRESQKKKLSSEEEYLVKDYGELKGREELPSNFEKMKAQKSTIEAAVSEVYMCLNLIVSKCIANLMVSECIAPKLICACP